MQCLFFLTFRFNFQVITQTIINIRISIEVQRMQSKKNKKIKLC